MSPSSSARTAITASIAPAAPSVCPIAPFMELTGTAELRGAMGEAGASVVGVDWRTNLVDAVARVPAGKALQGNLDPVVLLAGWPVVEQAVRTVVADGKKAVQAGATGHIFNLGHGVLPATDPGVITEAVALAHEL